jgi:hypothetical protein
VTVSRPCASSEARRAAATLAKERAGAAELEPLVEVARGDEADEEGEGRLRGVLRREPGEAGGLAEQPGEMGLHAAVEVGLDPSQLRSIHGLTEQLEHDSLFDPTRQLPAEEVPAKASICVSGGSPTWAATSASMIWPDDLR